MKRSDVVSMAVFAAATVAAARYGSRFSPRTDRRMRRWYQRLRKPPFQPPPPTYAIAWTGLYAMSTVSAWRVWRTDASRARTTALSLWTSQLGLNALWSRFFFGNRDPRLALTDSAALTANTAAYIAAARRVDRPAAWLMVPYLAWTAFATVLNGEIVRRN